jgi:hypothetical protein
MPEKAMKSTFLLPTLLLSASTQLFASPINLAYQKPNQAQSTRTVLDVDPKSTAYSVIDTLILPDSVLNKYVGAYQVEGTEDTVGFTNENHQLVAHTKNGRSWKLTAENPSKFVIEDKSASVEFTDMVEGKAQSAALTDKGDTKQARRKVS